MEKQEGDIKVRGTRRKKNMEVGLSSKTQDGHE